MIFTLNAEKRDNKKKSDLTRLRAAGMIPAIIYGGKMEPVKISLSDREFMKCYKKSFAEMSFYELNLAGKKYLTIMKDKHTHPTRRNFLHLDFMVVDQQSTIEMDIPVNLTGTAIGTQEGGFLDLIQRTVTIICKVSDAPEEFSYDVTNMKIGDTLLIGDLPKGPWNFKDTDDVPVAVIHGRMAAVETAEAGEAAEGEASEEATDEE